MTIINNLKKYKADWIDVALTKTAVFAATLFLAKLWNPVLSLDWYWYIIVCMIAAIKPMITFFKCMNSEGNK